MKTILLFILLTCTSNSFAQDSTQFKQIDSLVQLINNSGLKEQRDTILHNYQDGALRMKVCLAMVMDGKQLKKYVNHVITERKENGSVLITTTENTFYYNTDQLIMVDEYMEAAGKKVGSKWYFVDGKCLNDEEGKDGRTSRGTQLLGISKAMQNKVNN